MAPPVICVLPNGRRQQQYTEGYMAIRKALPSARLAQSVERKALNLVVVGSSPTVGVSSPQACQSPTYVTFEVNLP